MRRTDREVTDVTQIRAILEAAEVITLGIRTEDYPYVVPTNYGFEFDANNHLTLYLHGAPVGLKRRLIAADGRVGFAIETGGKVLVPKDEAHHTPSYAYQSVMGHGDATLVTDTNAKLHALQRITKHEVGHEWQAISDKDLAYVGVIQIQVTEYTAKANPGDPEKYIQ